MAAIGSCEANTHFAQLPEGVGRGERITITRHGVPVAALVSANADQFREPREIIDELHRFRAGGEVFDLQDDRNGALLLKALFHGLRRNDR